jgi:glycosyltransferase involved in cell wall biosynthesis
MTRVLLVHQPVDGGVGRHVSDLCAGLSANGVQVITCGPANPSGTPDHVHVRLELGRAATTADAVAAARLATIVRRCKPDLIHAHSSKAGAIARLARPANPRVPLVYTPHGYSFAGFFTSKTERLAYRVAETALAPLATRTLCVCEYEAKLARQIGSGSRVRVVHNGIGIRPPHVRSPPSGLEQLLGRGPVVTTVTQLRAGKGIETLIDAFAIVLDSYPTAQLAIWGDGPMLGALRGRAAATRGGRAVHFMGSAADPVSAIVGADLFAMPSWNESFPYVILEAMSVGLPVVATAVGGIGEAIRDRVEGALVPPRDPIALAGGIGALLADREARARLGAAGYERVQTRFTAERMIEGVTGVYRDLLDGRHT